MKILKTLLIALTLITGPGISAAAHSAHDQPFTQAELDQMLAPIALYPDTVLSHVLIAATYPLEIVQAARWSRLNPSLRGEQAVAAVERMNWDPSVKALVAFPELLKRLNEDLEWTQSLGDAFLMQEELVVETIQYLRSEAYAHGHLRSNEHVRVVRETRYIYIEPARSRVVYLPYYDPRVVYVGWRWASHPPVYWRHPPGYRSRLVFYWGPAYHVAPTFYFSSFHWPRRQVVSVHHHHHYHVYPKRQSTAHRWFGSAREIALHDSARHWQHNPIHRRGVSYRPGIDERRFVQQQPAAQTAGTRTVAANPTRTQSQQRQWADRQRSATPIRERAQTQTRNATISRTASVRGDATLQRNPGRTDSRLQSAPRSRESTLTSARASRSESTTRPAPTINRQASTPRREATVASPARASTPSPAARAAAAPRQPSATPQGQTRQVSRPSSQPRTSAVPSAASRSSSATPPRTQSSPPSRSSSPAASSSSSRSAAPRASAPASRSGSRSAPTPRSSATQRSTRQSARQID